MDYSLLNVFVVDDDLSMRSYLRRILESVFGLTVYEYGSPVPAFKAMVGLIPDLIILDMHTPHMSGFAAMKIINANEKLRDIPVFACTGDSSPKLIKELAKLGIKEYILKPFDLQSFIDRLRVYFDEIVPRKQAALADPNAPAATGIDETSLNMELTESSTNLPADES